MNSTVNLPAILGHYSNMSDGDKSCVAAMLQNPDAQQITSIGSSHDQSYAELASAGWAETVDIPAKLEETGIVRSWRFTEVGQRSMPTLGVALASQKLQASLRDKRALHLVKFAAKLATCYFACQLVMFSIGWTIGKLTLDIGSISGYLSIALLFVSIFVSLYFASKIWGRSAPDEMRLEKIAYSEFLHSEIRRVSIVSAIVILALQVMAEYLSVLFGVQAEAKTAGLLLTQVVLLFGVVWWFTKDFLPFLLKKERDRQFRPRNNS